MKRGFDDSSALPPELRDELSRSRRAGHDYDVLGKLPQLRAALAAAQATGDDPLAEQDVSPLGGTDAAGSALAPAAWKIAVIATVVGTCVFVAWPAPRHTPPPAPAARMERPVEPPAPAPLSMPAPAREPEPEVAAPESPASPESATPAPARASAPSRSSRREIADLERIRALLERDPQGAYRLAQRSDREFPRGLLREERKALQVLALAKSGDKAAAERGARAFLAQYPQSPLRELVEATLQR